jgi:peptidoglycan-N-acetylglucosamine deacetylase
MKACIKAPASLEIKLRNWKIRPPVLLRWLFPGTLWRIPTKDKRVFLTFDDGPIPEVTPLVIECLKQQGAVATFFCIGDNVRKHPEVFKMLRDSGMSVGNHSFSHLKAWSNSSEAFQNDIEKCSQMVESSLFRPPHGQLYPWYVAKLKKNFRHIVMWDLLSLDYRKELTSDEIVNIVIKNVRPGSIIVFHDSLKAWPRLQSALPLVLLHLKKENYITDIIV